MTTHTPATIHHALRRAETKRRELRDQAHALRSLRQQLQRQGMVRGSLHQQEKRPGYKVWYLNVSTSECKPGRRERRYIGNDPDELAAVKDEIARAAKYDKLGLKLQAVTEAMQLLGGNVLAAIELAEYELRRW